MVYFNTTSLSDFLLKKNGVSCIRYAVWCFCVLIAAAGVVDQCAGRAPSVACLSRVSRHAYVCPACWLHGYWDLDRRRNWSLRSHGMFEDVFWRIIPTVMQFVFFQQ